MRDVSGIDVCRDFVIAGRVSEEVLTGGKPRHISSARQQSIRIILQGGKPRSRISIKGAGPPGWGARECHDRAASAKNRNRLEIAHPSLAVEFQTTHMGQCHVRPCGFGRALANVLGNSEIGGGSVDQIGACLASRVRRPPT